MFFTAEVSQVLGPASELLVWTMPVPLQSASNAGNFSVASHELHPPHPPCPSQSQPQSWPWWRLCCLASEASHTTPGSAAHQGHRAPEGDVVQHESDFQRSHGRNRGRGGRVRGGRRDGCRGRVRGRRRDGVVVV